MLLSKLFTGCSYLLKSQQYQYWLFSGNFQKTRTESHFFVYYSICLYNSLTNLWIKWCITENQGYVYQRKYCGLLRGMLKVKVKHYVAVLSLDSLVLMMVRNSTLTHYIYCLSMWQKKNQKKSWPREIS